jgi:carbon monoxide dehydrogenase subunit G
MTPIVHEIEISRPPETVFPYVTDPMTFAEWQRDVVRARLLDDGPLQIGSRIATTRRIARTELTQVQEITENDPFRRWAVRGLEGPIRAHARITVEPLRQGAASRVTFALDFEGPGVGKLFVPQIRRIAAKQAPHSYRNLKERLERQG